MAEMTQQEQGGDQVGSTERSTMQTTHDDQARGYLESLAEGEFIAELQSALRHAHRLTKKDWKIVITRDEVEIDAQRPPAKRIKLPRPKTLQD